MACSTGRGDLALDLERRQRRRDGVDLDLHRRRVGEGVERQARGRRGRPATATPSAARGSRPAGGAATSSMMRVEHRLALDLAAAGADAALEGLGLEQEAPRGRRPPRPARSPFVTSTTSPSPTPDLDAPRLRTSPRASRTKTSWRHPWRAAPPRAAPSPSLAPPPSAIRACAEHVGAQRAVRVRRAARAPGGAGVRIDLRRDVGRSCRRARALRQAVDGRASPSARARRAARSASGTSTSAHIVEVSTISNSDLVGVDQCPTVAVALGHHAGDRRGQACSRAAPLRPAADHAESGAATRRARPAPASSSCCAASTSFCGAMPSRGAACSRL